jgi:hypothetical protein
MRIILKIIAIIFALSVLATLSMALRFWHHGGIRALATSGVFGWSTLLGWALGLTLGPYTAVQLWRIRSGGRISALVLIAYGVSYYVLGWLFSRPRAKAPAWVLNVAWEVLIALLLLLPSARKACTAKSASTV